MQKSTPDKFCCMKWQEAGWRTIATEGPPASARSFTLSAAFWLEMVCVSRVPRLGQITWRIVLTKKWGSLAKKLHQNREIAGDSAVGVWVHMERCLQARIDSVLKLNTNAQGLPVLSHLVRSARQTLNLNCWSLLRNLQLESPGTLISVNFQHFSIFPKKTPNLGVFAKNLSKVCLRKLSLFCSPVSPSWAERDLIKLLFSWYKTYHRSLLAGTCKSNTADIGKRWIELDPDECERRGACGFLDLYM